MLDRREAARAVFDRGWTTPRKLCGGGGAPDQDAGHRDEPVMKAPTVRQTVEKVKDVLGMGEGR